MQDEYWEQEEIDFFKENYLKKGGFTICRNALHCGDKTLRNLIRILNLPQPSHIIKPKAINKLNQNNYNRQRYATNPNVRLRHNLTNRVNLALKRAYAQKSKNTLSLIGCTVAFLRIHLESQFEPGMNWDNRRAWHIDHIKPCASFDLTKPEEQAVCFYYTNLQPLWAIDNLKKGAKVLVL